MRHLQVGRYLPSVEYLLRPGLVSGAATEEMVQHWHGAWIVEVGSCAHTTRIRQG